MEEVAVDSEYHSVLLFATKWVILQRKTRFRQQPRHPNPHRSGRPSWTFAWWIPSRWPQQRQQPFRRRKQFRYAQRIWYGSPEIPQQLWRGRGKLRIEHRLVRKLDSGESSLLELFSAPGAAWIQWIDSRPAIYAASIVIMIITSCSPKAGTTTELPLLTPLDSLHTFLRSFLTASDSDTAHK